MDEFILLILLLLLMMMTWAGPEGVDRGVRTPPPLKNYKNVGFLSNTGPDPLKNRKATKPAFNGVSLEGRWWPVLVVHTRTHVRTHYSCCFFIKTFNSRMVPFWFSPLMSPLQLCLFYAFYLRFFHFPWCTEVGRINYECAYLRITPFDIYLILLSSISWKLISIWLNA